MVSKEMWALGANRSVIRDLFEYGLQQAKVVGPENVFDYSLGNPSIPSPPQVNETVVEILRDMDSIRVHGYTSALGDMETRSAIAADLNDRYGAGIRPENLFICCGAAPGLIAIMRALAATPEAEFVAIAPFFPEYRPFAKAAGGNLVVVPADTEHFQVNLGLGAGHYPPYPGSDCEFSQQPHGHGVHGGNHPGRGTAAHPEGGGVRPSHLYPGG